MSAVDIGMWGLYVADVENGEVVAVGPPVPDEQALAFEAWLPDGRIVAGSGNTLLAVDLSNGLLTSLWEGERVKSVAPSPDGALLACIVPGRIIFVLTDGTGKVGGLEAKDVGPLAWSDDGQWLAFMTDRQNRAPSLPSVSVVSRDDLSTATRLGGASAFAWSADRPQLLLASTDGIAEVALPSGSRHDVYHFSDDFSALLSSGTAHVYSIAWSPSSQYVALAVGFVSYQGATASTLVVPLNGVGGIEFAGSEFQKWLPGVDRVLVKANWCSYDEQFALMTLEGEVLSTVGRGNGLFGELSPDGDKLAYILHVGKSGQTDDVISVAGTADGVGSDIASSSRTNFKLREWSPDGKKLAFVATGGFGWCEMAQSQELEIRPSRW